MSVVAVNREAMLERLDRLQALTHQLARTRDLADQADLAERMVREIELVRGLLAPDAP
ncbi:MAG TPA: hypothetical protein VN628_09490 [Vicinamibacterales bacterium]|nr:hypothetical protein [Vicinamibacterales bacterium]